ncbi:phytanoyl-CoA dioxygenase family protein [Aquimarina sp. MMG015]|uniref:phytanoyl-CoA dioxygenase family protein n=1 Tax=Aquimarina sp. MMG015 TaxID=2822689 RepID=UPI001B3A103C|nr:phytanoyl-CoA dioxygenase family protein [Aquimarina sp. MMG015]MBQ4802721.1 phytanoyl-CoA dioxygenase family protein [Aquimarina sp. MMG015]
MSITELFYKQGYLLFNEDILLRKDYLELCDRYTKIFEGKLSHNFPAYNCWGIGTDEKIKKIDQAHLFDSVILEIISTPILGKRISEITSATRVSIAASHVFYKSPFSGIEGSVGWHTDTKYVNFKNGDLLSMYIPLSVINERSGTLTFLKGSHLWENNNISLVNDGAEKNTDKQRQQIIKDLPQDYIWNEEKAIIKQGGVSFHHDNIWHFSEGNKTEKPRITISVALHIEKGNDLSEKVSIKNTIFPIFSKNNEPKIIYDGIKKI